MTDPKDELSARFNERKPDGQDEGNIDHSDNPDNSSNSNNPSNTGNTGDTNNKPGPEKDQTATRHRQQVPMYLPDQKAEKLNKLYERLDGRSKIAGNGAIEKHADFMETVVEFAVEHEDQLAERLEVE